MGWCEMGRGEVRGSLMTARPKGGGSSGGYSGHPMAASPVAPGEQQCAPLSSDCTAPTARVSCRPLTNSAGQHRQGGQDVAS